MVGIRMPDEQVLPPGSRRDLAVALFELYDGAGKPSVRLISEWIGKDEDDDLPGTLSHEGVSSALRVAAMPRWLNLESLVRVLFKNHRVPLRYADADAAVARIQFLWSIANGSVPAEVSEDSKLQPEQPVARLKIPNVGTFDFMTEKVAVEVVGFVTREKGDSNDQS
jgi:hypothetical protein